MSIEQDIARVMGNAVDLMKYLDKSIQAKTLLRRASKVAVTTMKAKAPVGETGNLERSIKFIPSRKRKSVMIGPSYGKGGGNHANLIEFGFVHPSGKRVEGQPFVVETDDETKGQILANLRTEIKKEFDKAGKSIRGFDI